MPTTARTATGRPSRTWPAPEGTDLRAIRSLVRDVTAGMPDEERLVFARSFCHRAVVRYWEASCPGAGELGGLADCAVDREPIAEVLLRRAHRVGSHLAQLPKPLAAYFLSTLYTALLPEEIRSRSGAFFTPPSLVEQLLDLVEGAGIDWRCHTVIDPAAGGGAFVAPVAARVAAALARTGAAAKEILDHIAIHVAGVELDPFSGWMAQVFLEVALWEYCRAAGTRLPNVVARADALALPDGWRGGYDLVVGNPPYGRITLEPEVRDRYARSLYGHANLYGLFTDLALRLAKRGGVIGYVTPASFLGGQYFKNLRRLLAAEAHPVALDFITDRSGVFDEVLQETVLVVLGQAREPQTVAVRSARPVALAAPCETIPIGSFSLPEDGQAPWTFPRTRDDASLLDRCSGMQHRLVDHGFAVSTGPLVWNRHKEQLTFHPGPDCYPLIWAESVLPSGEFRFSWARRNHAPYFRLRNGQEHLVVREPVALLQRTTAKEQDRRLIAAVLPEDFLQKHGGAVIENHLNMVRPVSGRARISLRAVCALLNSGIVDRVFRCMSGSVAVSAFELGSLPLPSPETMQELDPLLESGATPARVEAFLRRAYGEPGEAVK